ncbi:MAG: hypothetical protein KAI64_01485 [Thermoplasmata archaeon]|nr:hypothetical protein [Thermoplasmata archaeon]
MALKKWESPPPEICDLCAKPIDGFFVDGALKSGSWACMCPECHEIQGIGFGIGSGQLYWLVGEDWIAIFGGSVQERRLLE